MLQLSYPWDGLWKDLVSNIKSQLKHLAVLRSLERGTRRTVKGVGYRKESHNDQCGAPLFADLQPEVYLSNLYAPADIDILKILGLECLKFSMIIEMVKQGLEAGPKHSMIKSPNTDNDWHTRAYKLLNRILKHPYSDNTRSLKQLDIIPLQEGSWVSPDIGDIFYPGSGNVVVPKDLGMRLVDPMATRNKSRCDCFDDLGVHRINVPIVFNIRERILQRPQ